MTRSNAVTPDYYEILNIQSTGNAAQLSKQQLKLAYHKALLKHHPDKASSVADLPRSIQDLSHDSKTYTIDEITTAYKTLSDPQLRAEYDRALRLDRAKIIEREKTGAVFHTGLEVVDLEDLACEEDSDSAFWYRDCRCGDEKGFLVSEEDLEREAEHGEIVIGCRGCSLWMKVLFAVEDG
ncbi:CSL zinc finger-domain-containing protein [Aspergillus tamarii]|uniref:Diphthamide biosynthesis protein 4 n=1 Tax=Aspergillus tamarii TaxID=41984 RepID=A0A5N6UYG9_ASPTM|nr:CSL zinc finger-domain-containing protein [Aspergillus tamarii]